MISNLTHSDSWSQHPGWIYVYGETAPKNLNYEILRNLLEKLGNPVQKSVHLIIFMRA